MLSFQGSLWICNFPDGLIRFDLTSEKFTRIPVSDHGSGLAGSDVVSVVPWSEEYLLVAIDHGGLNLLNINTYETRHYRHNPSDPQSLVNDQLLTIYYDDNNIYWIGHYRGGLSYFTPSHTAFINYEQDQTKRSLSANSVTCIFEDSNSSVWIGTDGGGLNKLDPESGNIIHFRHDPDNANSLSSDLIACFYEDSENSLWVGTFYGGLNKFDPQSETSIRYGPEESGNYFLNSTIVHSIMEDSKGNLWISTLNKGIFVKKNGSERFEGIDSLAGQDLISLAIQTIIEDHKNRIWIGFDDIGVICYDPEADSLA